MSDDETKDDALVPHQPQFLTKRSAALARRGLADALILQSSTAYSDRGESEIDKTERRKLTPEQWNRVVERVQEYLNAIRARRDSANSLDLDLPPSRPNRSDD